MRWFFSFLWKLFALFSLATVYLETPDLPQTFLVESLRHVKAFYLRDLGSKEDEAVVNPLKYRVLKVLDYDI